MREFRPSTGIEYISNQANLVQSKNFDQTLEVKL